MKYQFGVVLLMIIIVVLVDLFLFWRWRKAGYSKKVIGAFTAYFLFIFVPLFFIAGFLFFGNWVREAQSAGIYSFFGYYLFSFLLIYIPKVIYSKFHGIGLVISKIRSGNGEREKVRHYPRITRRKFMSQMGIIMATAPFVSLLFGAFKGRYAFYTKHIRLSFPNLPEGFDGFRIVHISDLHIGSFGTNQQPIIDAVNLINDEHPDVILFTGDMVNNFAGEMNGWDPVFAKLKASMGKYSILGNHDYGLYSRWESVEERRSNFEGIVSGHKNLGFKLLRNQSLQLRRNGDTIGLSGVENWGTSSHPKRGDLEKASTEIQNETFNLLMSHDPDHWDKKVLEHNFFDLTLSGHTHGMQFGIEKGDFKWSPAQYVQKRWAGLFREGDRFMYVNRGLGYHGIPARVGMPPEITVIELSRGPIGTEPM